MRLRKGRKQVGMVLMAVIAALLLGGAPARAARGGPASGNVLDWAWGWVRSLWEGADKSMLIDPNGTPRVTSDEGPHIDPDGSTVSGPAETPRETTDEGMHIDPNG